MTSVTIYATDIGSNNLKVSSATYNNVLIATDAEPLLATTANYVGAFYNTGSSLYISRQLLLSFDLSSIPSTSTITNASFSVLSSSATIEAPTAGSQLELIPYDWGFYVKESDYLTKAEYSAIAAVATYPKTTSITASQVLTFTSGAPLIANLLPGATSKFMLGNKAFRNGTVPIGRTDESDSIYGSSYSVSSYRPALTITYSAGSPASIKHNATFFGSNF